ncbi:MAG: glutathione peroxidase [Bauldia litoralis]
MNAHEFVIPAIEGGTIALSNFKGKPVLLVNTASECGFTPQYRDLEELWSDLGEQGLVVLGIPSNDFGGQEPGGESEIKAFCEATYAVSFPMTAKQAVIGDNAHPLYRWIAEQLGEDAAPKWNFHKYLIDGEGNLVGAWPSKVRPNDPEIRAAIEKALA